MKGVISRAAAGVVALAMLESPEATAQDVKPRIALGVGTVVYDGAGSEGGVGAAGSVQLTLAHIGRVEFTAGAGMFALAAVGQTCTLGAPSACSPDDPASPVWHLRTGLSRRVRLGLSMFATVGMGMYGPVGPASGSSPLAWGVDLGLGVHVSQSVALELRYLHLRAENAIGTAIPFLVRVQL